MPDTSLRYLIVMGVTGSGKSTVGKRTAQRLGWTFVDGDTLHPAANVEKMRAGVPLDDADRQPWLASIVQTLRQWRAAGRCGVVACSALRRGYRATLVDGHKDVGFVYLHGSRALLARRLSARRGHFMPSGLLDSQLATLEEPRVPPERACRLEIDQAPDRLARQAARFVIDG